MVTRPTRSSETIGRTMSKNAAFDEILASIFVTLDGVYQLHSPERPEDENDPGNCVHCNVDFPCPTEDIILEGLANVSILMANAKEENEEA